LVAALAVVGLVIWAVRRQGDEADTFTPIGTAAQPLLVPGDGDSEAGEGRTAASDPRAATVRAAGVSPDQALAALQRTVEEVTSKLDASVAESAKVKVPGASPEVVTRRAVSEGAPPGSGSRPSGGSSGPAGHRDPATASPQAKTPQAKSPETESPETESAGAEASGADGGADVERREPPDG
jgi:hypothetical protein